MKALSLVFLGIFLAPTSANAMETKLYIQNSSTVEYTLVTSTKKINLPVNAILYLALEDHFELYNTSDVWYLECLKRKLPTLIVYHAIESHKDGNKMRIFTLEQKKPVMCLLKRLALCADDARDVECIVAGNLAESKLHVICQ